jgi:hypothetical protein
MVLSETEIAERFNDSVEWLVFLNVDGHWRHYGKGEMPPLDREGHG